MKLLSVRPTQPPKQPARARRAPSYCNEGSRAADAPCRPKPRPPLDPSLAELLTLLPSVRAIRGRLGDVVFRTYGRKIVVTRAPNFAGYVPTAAQRTRRDRMREATAYAKRVYADPTAKAFYTAAAKKLGRQPFRLAVSDYLRADARVAIVTAHWTQAVTPPTPIHPTPRRQPHRAPIQVARRNTGERIPGVSVQKFHSRQTEDEPTLRNLSSRHFLGSTPVNRIGDRVRLLGRARSPWFSARRRAS